MATSISFRFNIPFDGPPAIPCSEAIHGVMTEALLSRLSEIHPDIEVFVTTEFKPNLPSDEPA